MQIPLFDAQHKKLAGMINDLLIAIGNKTSASVIEEIVSRMTAYTEYHFNSEEKYFEKYDYPSKEEHIQAHQSFIDELHKFQAEMTRFKFLISLKVYHFLKNWIITHIAGMDKEYTEFFKRHQVDLIKPE